MKKIILLASLCAVSPLGAAVLQSFDGPYNISGGGLGTLLVDTTSDTNDWLSNYSGGTSTTALYYSVTLSVTNNAGETGTGGFFAGLTSYSNGTGSGTERLLVGNQWESTAWSATSGGTLVLLNANAGVGGNNVITPTETATFWVKIDQAANQGTIWFNPTLSLTEGAQDAGLTTSFALSGTADTFDRFYLRAGNGAGAATYSNITFRDDSPFLPVPEPGSALLAVVACAGLLRRRR